MRRVLFASMPFVLTLVGCDESVDEATDRARLHEMKAEILALVSDPACADSLDCRYTGLGTKPCGGPWEYIVYSVASVDSSELAAQVAAYNDFNEELNLRYGWVSDCSVPPPPVVGCQDGRCVDLSAP
jgi:hypothetical protein